MAWLLSGSSEHPTAHGEAGTAHPGRLSTSPLVPSPDRVTIFETGSGNAPTRYRLC